MNRDDIDREIVLILAREAEDLAEQIATLRRRVARSRVSRVDLYEIDFGEAARRLKGAAKRLREDAGR